jgi:hypothetical protein
MASFADVLEHELRLKALDDYNTLQHYMRDVGGTITSYPRYETNLTLPDGQKMFDAALLFIELKEAEHNFFGKFSVTLVDSGRDTHAILSFEDVRDGVEFKLRMP